MWGKGGGGGGDAGRRGGRDGAGVHVEGGTGGRGRSEESLSGVRDRVARGGDGVGVGGAFEAGAARVRGWEVVDGGEDMGGESSAELGIVVGHGDWTAAYAIPQEALL